MRREWKPGDVFSGRIQQRNREMFYVVAVTANSRAAWGDGLHAINADGNGYHIHDIADPRPVVVIEPEDWEAVYRLNRLYYQGRSGGRAQEEALQVALREFANPPKPKPPEPTGLGAVVEDTEGRRWVRDESGTGEARVWYRRGVATCQTYADIAAVRVLSEGVTEDGPR